ncbi:hypothetical protein V866_005808 [Kwoniella sp. B9012]
MKVTLGLLSILAYIGHTSAAPDPGLAAWHLDNLYPLATERLDPVVNPNGVASHLHRIVGGSAFGANYNYDEYNGASCSTAAVQADKSNYWMPQLFWRENSTYVPLKAGTRFYYFLHRNKPDEPVRAFPPGLRMLTGNLNAKSYAETGLPTGAINFICLKNHFSTPNGDTGGPDFNFDIDCPQGLVTTVRFPTCWDGVNLYKADGSHMKYTDNLQFGVCPASHPVRIPGIMLEYTWQTYAYRPGVPLRNKLIWANGDTTGFGLHADFVNGWDTNVLEKALNDPDCLSGDMTMTACPTLAMYMNLGTAQSCQPSRGVLESYEDFKPIGALPGCNLPWSSGSKPACNPSVPNPSIPNSLKGTDGSLTYSGPSYLTNTSSPPNTWTRQGCIGGSTSLVNSFQYSDAAMTQAKCQSTCAEWGSQYAGLLSGQYCVCGTDLDPAAYHYADSNCNSPCGGDSTKTCGGNGKLELFRNPSATTVNHPGVSDPQYIGCRREGGTGHALTAAYINYDSMTVEWCKNYCTAQKQTLAAIEFGRTCMCGSSWQNGGGIPYPQNQCNTPCKGNTQQFCGGPQITISTFNLTLPGGSSPPVSSSASASSASAKVTSSSASSGPSGAVTVTKTVTVTGTCSAPAGRRRNHRDMRIFGDA